MKKKKKTTNCLKEARLFNAFGSLFAKVSIAHVLHITTIPTDLKMKRAHQRDEVSRTPMECSHFGCFMLFFGGKGGGDQPKIQIV